MMKTILKFMADDFMWLFEEYDFKITDSRYSKSFGGEGMISLKNSVLRIRFVSDRDLVFLEFSPIEGWKPEEFISVDIIKQILTGKQNEEGNVTCSQIIYLRANFNAILNLFEKSGLSELRTRVKQLKKERAKRLFG